MTCPQPCVVYTPKHAGLSREQIDLAVTLDLGQRAAELLIAAFEHWPDKQVARELLISFGTWRAWKTRRQRPNNVFLTHLFTRLGPNFVAACVAPWSHAGPNVAAFQRTQPKPTQPIDSRRKVAHG